MAPAQCWNRTGTPLNTPGINISLTNERTGVVTGGWTYGVEQCATCHITYTMTNNVIGGTDTFDASETGNMTCTWGGLFWTVTILGSNVSIRIAAANYVYGGLGAPGYCTYNLYCVQSTATCGFQTIQVATPCGSNYFVQYSLVERTGVNSHCFPVSIGRFSSQPVPCS
jgi:hypothetical protein